MSEIDRLRAAAAALEPDRVLRGLDRAIDAWRAAESEERARLAREHPLYSAEVVHRGVTGELGGWTREALERLRRDAFARPCRAPAVTGVWLAGAIPTASFRALLLPLLAGSAVYARTASADPLSPRRFVESLRDADAGLADAISLEGDAGALARVDAAIVHGSDDTIEALRPRVAPGRPFVAHGHKLSLDVVGSAADPAAAARAVALDLAQWDGRGCLSPGWVLVAAPLAETFCHALAAALGRLRDELPRGPLAPEEEAWIHDTRARAALREGTRLWLPESHALGMSATDWTVVLEAPAAPRPAPGLLRCVPVVRFGSEQELSHWCAALAPHLSSLGHVGFGDRGDELEPMARAGGGSRVCPAGELQLPRIDWHHDGVAPLASLLRYPDCENDED